MRLSAERRERNARSWSESVQTTCAENRVVGQPREANFVEDAGHLAQQIHCDPVGFAQLNAECKQRDYRPLSEPAVPVVM